MVFKALGLWFLLSGAVLTLSGNATEARTRGEDSAKLPAWEMTEAAGVSASSRLHASAYWGKDAAGAVHGVRPPRLADEKAETGAHPLSKSHPGSDFLNHSQSEHNSHTQTALNTN